MSLKKTICMIGPFPPPINGQSVALDILINSNRIQELYSVVKIDYSPKKYLNKFVKIPYKILCNYKMLSQLRKAIRKQEVDIFYLTISSSNQGLLRDYLIAKTIFHYNPDAKFVIHHHGGNFRSFYNKLTGRRKSYVDYYLKHVSCVIVLTEKLRNLFAGLVPDEKIRVVSNGISDSSIVPKNDILSRIESLSYNRELNIVYLSNMIRTKGYFELLQSAEILLDKKLKFKMTFAGAFKESNEKELFLEYIRQHELQNVIQYLGVVTGVDKTALLSTNDIFVLPTYYPNEGQPISILEALAAGMVVITTNHGGISDVVKDGYNGVLLESNLPSEIANAITCYNSDRAMMKSIALSNVHEAKENYMESNYIDGMIDLFNDVLVCDSFSVNKDGQYEK